MRISTTISASFASKTYVSGAADAVMTNNIDKVTDITWYVML